MKRTPNKFFSRLAPSLALVFVATLSSGTIRAAAVTFSNLTLDSESQWNGDDTTYDNGSGEANPFVSGDATFNNYHEHLQDYYGNPTHYWDGWAYSNRTDVEATGIAGQYTAFTDPAGGQGDSKYGIAYFGWYGRVPTVSFSAPRSVESACFTNNAYAYDSMLNGDSFAKQFGGAGGTDEDWFLLTITGKDAGGLETGTLDFYLADYRFPNSGDDYIVGDWTSVDLSSLGQVSSLEFAIDSSDVGMYGMNTPAYFAIDSLTLTPIPEPSIIVLILIAGVSVLAWRRLKQR